MRLMQLTPGTGSFYCGSCLRDNALVKAMSALGHEVTLVPLYLPFALEESESPDQTPRVFLGGINMYLRQRFPRLARSFAPLAKVLDAPNLLRFVSRRSDMTDAHNLGEMTVATLALDESRMAVELDKLMHWIQTQERPEVFSLSNVMLSAIARKLKRETGRPILCSLQGEAPFLDSLPEPYREKAWSTLRARIQDVDHFIAVSRYYGDLMAERLGIPDHKLTVVPNGISLDDFGPKDSPLPSPSQPTIGYLARMCEDKGLDRLVDAFLRIREKRDDVQLRVCGVKLNGDESFVEKQKHRLKKAGLENSVEFLFNVDRSTKLEFLKSLSVLSVPAPYGESFGLYLIEAMASGVPVVQPRLASFPEIIEDTGGGLLCEPDHPEDLAEKLGMVLDRKAQSDEMARRGREAVFDRYHSGRMAQDIIALAQQVLDPAHPTPQSTT